MEELEEQTEQKMGNRPELKRLIIYLASDAARFAAGQVIILDIGIPI